MEYRRANGEEYFSFILPNVKYGPRNALMRMEILRYIFDLPLSCFSNWQLRRHSKYSPRITSSSCDIKYYIARHSKASHLQKSHNSLLAKVCFDYKGPLQVMSTQLSIESFGLRDGTASKTAAFLKPTVRLSAKLESITQQLFSSVKAL
uniref:Uncharacterized protein n=1 Tax=Glossina austeni TaxID=7395 RepID=A0A1A9UP70_GLOAU